ncbi:endoplasmic reticulum resident protein 44-like [Babylonia areolata]|uniref:endoplasmic reticulum resident protein 44-like n=1 Tax=Babylonia areolata TaxID=304850 RepID=UPI003FD5B91E
MLPVKTKRCWFGLMSLLLINLVEYCHAGDAVALNNDNINSIIGRNDVVFVNFYADWCRFSQILAPVFDEASRKISEEFTQPGRVMFAKVDCDREVTIASQYRISKYPTLKLFRNGQMVKKEYRGQRSADALAAFIRDELKDPVVEHNTLDKLDELDTKKRQMLGYFESKDSDNYRNYVRVASMLRDDCNFNAAFGAVSASERIGGDSVGFRQPNTKGQDVMFMGPLNNFDQLFAWAFEKCVPLVREITFENAEELTEEGLPFLILFHKPEDTEVADLYRSEVAKQILSEKNSVNFLIADGSQFTHPLHHLGKSVSDLPVLAIDSFRHMYIFPHDVREGLRTPGLLKQFLNDLHSGKLHREFHHGPDPTPAALSPDGNAPGHIPKDQGVADGQGQKETQPPESTFRKLAPSRNRYTILRDEL